ncbi:MAG: hypothetical protein Q8M51_12905 [Polaromonas sp.]|nr:hypothetical protein [Polaromonas sp.]
MQTYKPASPPALRFKRCLGEREEVSRAILRVMGDAARTPTAPGALTVLPLPISVDPTGSSSASTPLPSQRPYGA